MKTSVIKDIIDHSISGDKIYGGSIDALDSITTENLIVTSYANLSEANVDFKSVDGAQSLTLFYSEYLNTASSVEALYQIGLGELTAGNVTSVGNMGSVSINLTQWTKLKDMQDVKTTSEVQFSGLTVNGVDSEILAKGSVVAEVRVSSPAYTTAASRIASLTDTFDFVAASAGTCTCKAAFAKVTVNTTVCTPNSIVLLTLIDTIPSTVGAGAIRLIHTGASFGWFSVQFTGTPGVDWKFNWLIINPTA